MDNFTKSIIRRGYDRRFTTRWLVGDGIDIGFDMDRIIRFRDYFPLVSSLHCPEYTDESATSLIGIADESYDFVHSYGALAKVKEPLVAMTNWIRVCKRGGYIIIILDDEDHRQDTRHYARSSAQVNWTFAVLKARSASSTSISVTNFIAEFVHELELIKIELVDTHLIYPEFLHHEMNEISECSIELVLRRRPNPEPEPTIFAEPPDIGLSDTSHSG